MRAVYVVLILTAMWQHGGAQGTCPATGTNCIYNNIALLPTSNSDPNSHYYIGGLFGIHQNVNNAYACADAPLRVEEVINLEAFLWAIDKYRRIIHNNISIGGVAFDTCSRYQQTIEGILSFETCKITLSDTNPPSPRNLLAYIGPGDNYDTMSSAKLLKDMNKTQVSYGASTNLLSRKGEAYDFLLRTIPSDAINLKALSVLIRNQLKAKYVQVLYSNDEFGVAEYTKFKEEAESLGICIVYQSGIPAEPSASEIFNIADTVYRNQKTRHVLLLAPKTQARNFLTQMKQRNSIDFRKLMFFGTWDSSVVDGLDVSAYTTTLRSPGVLDPDVNEFYTHLDNLKPKRNSQNKKWFTEFWNLMLDCGTRTCNEDTDSLAGRYQRSPHVPYILAAVKAVIQGIKDGATRACTTGILCSNYLNVNNRGQQIYTGIINATGGPYFQTSGVMKGDASNAFSDLQIHLYEALAGQPVKDTLVSICYSVCNDFLLEIRS